MHLGQLSLTIPPLLVSTTTTADGYSDYMGRNVTYDCRQACSAACASQLITYRRCASHANTYGLTPTGSKRHLANATAPRGPLCLRGIFMVALCNRADHYIFILFLLSSFFFFFLLSFPRLISAVGDWMFTILWHMVWP